ncbi:cilia- and flagella-associated protein 206-like [Pocillopora damicornis]|uniref:cilia- and flagella-associated protein 206-like n=1 Tax=Pocillopora damicornis TaxID=46731 RepID=UPI000F550949|nr:cilia- and flagella-associated protein 206-like [Pocillopora damicornis]
MSRAQAESVIKNIIREIAQECANKGQAVSETLVAFMVKAVVLDPDNEFNVDRTLTKDDVQKLIMLCVDRLLDSQSPSLDTVKMQVYFDMNYTSRGMHKFSNLFLQNDVVGCAQQVEALESQFSARMEALKNTVQSKTAVPTAQVYPQFITLAHLWTGFQDEMVLLSVLSNILASLEPFTKIHREVLTEEVLQPYIDGLEIRTDDQRLADSSSDDDRIDGKEIDNPKIELLFHETTKNFDKLPIQYRGFCGWSLVVYDRLLIPSNPGIGVLRYKDNYYAFCDKQAAYEFSNAPESYINGVAEAAKKSPELIQLLELHTQFASITPYAQGKEPGRMIEAPVTKCDSGTQTDTHFMETNIVKSYEWNEWELRRKALKLANLRTKITHSVQTNLSNFRRDNDSQVYLPKNVETQTKRESSTNVPKPSTFVAGLRGCNSTKTTMNVVDLTLDVDQT